MNRRIGNDRAHAVEHPRHAWDRVRPTSALGWVAVVLTALHVAVAALVLGLEDGYWTPDALWDDPWVVTAAAVLAASALAAGTAALVATARHVEHSVLMLVPAVLGAFWLLWLADRLPGWLG